MAVPDAPPPDILTTPDGSRTAFNARFGEAYGSRHGAAAQAQHVFVQGTQTDQHSAPRVLEIGFGVGLNFRATLETCARRGVSLDYLAYEFDPAPLEVLREVAGESAAENYPLWRQLLEGWPAPGASRPVQPLVLNDGKVRLTIHFQDVTEADLPTDWATALYLDGFSPTRNPEVWTPDFVSRLARSLQPGGILATYSAAGHVRRSLAAAGLVVERRPGAPGKRECLRAIQRGS